MDEYHLLFDQNISFIQKEDKSFINEAEIRNNLKRRIEAEQYPLAVNIVGMVVGITALGAAIYGLSIRLPEAISSFKTISSVWIVNYAWMFLGGVGGLLFGTWFIRVSYMNLRRRYSIDNLYQQLLKSSVVDGKVIKVKLGNQGTANVILYTYYTGKRAFKDCYETNTDLQLKAIKPGDRVQVVFFDRFSALL